MLRNILPPPQKKIHKNRAKGNGIRLGHSHCSLLEEKSRLEGDLKFIRNRMRKGRRMAKGEDEKKGRCIREEKKFPISIRAEDREGKF